MKQNDTDRTSQQLFFKHRIFFLQGSEQNRKNSKVEFFLKTKIGPISSSAIFAVFFILFFTE